MEVKSQDIYRKDGEIFRIREECDYLFLVQTGLVDEVYEDLKDKQDYKRVYQRGKGAVLGIGNVCSADNKNIHSLKAFTDCKLYKIRRSKLLLPNHF